ncbi:hypothetical protein GGI11_004532 [Coemansia sp. RSA 2049]|nr:hypothetical protein GGI11_004532 [Coemansia sp. RSA 2049]
MEARNGSSKLTGSRWQQTLAELILVPIYTERFRLEARARKKKTTYYVRPHGSRRQRRPHDEISEESGTYRYEAFHDTLTRYAQYLAEDKSGAMEDTSLRAIAGEIARIGVVAIGEWVRLDHQHQQQASQLLLSCMEIDRRHDEAYALTTEMLQAVGKAELRQRHLYPVCIGLVGEEADGVAAEAWLSESANQALFELLYQGRCFAQIRRMAGSLGARKINAEIARLALCSIRNEQRREAEEPSARRRQKKRRQALYHSNSEWRRGHHSQHGVEARRVLWRLEQRGRHLVSAAHVTKVLEIAIAADAGPPRGMEALLGDFERLGIDPDVQALTLIINTYIERGAPAQACRIYEQMQAGEMPVATGDGRPAPRVVSLPQPNDVTLQTVAKAWCALGDYSRAIDVLETLRQREAAPGSQALVTRLVAWLADAGDLDAAETLWARHGLDYTPFATSRRYKHARINRRALARLVVGHAHAGNLDRAISLLQIACDHERPVPSSCDAHTPAATRYLTDLVNAVLRACLDSSAMDSNPGDRAQLLRRGVDVVRMATRSGAQLNAATYNLLLAGLSRAAQHLQSAEHAEIAAAMQQLYDRMLSEHIVPDDASLVHLVPMWASVGRSSVAASHWRTLVAGKPPHKIARLRVHVVQQARRWNLSTSALLDITAT